MTERMLKICTNLDDTIACESYHKFDQANGTGQDSVGGRVVNCLETVDDSRVGAGIGNVLVDLAVDAALQIAYSVAEEDRGVDICCCRVHV